MAHFLTSILLTFASQYILPPWIVMVLGTVVVAGACLDSVRAWCDWCQPSGCRCDASPTGWRPDVRCGQRSGVASASRLHLNRGSVSVMRLLAAFGELQPVLLAGRERRGPDPALAQAPARFLRRDPRTRLEAVLRTGAGRGRGEIGTPVAPRPWEYGIALGLVRSRNVDLLVPDDTAHTGILPRLDLARVLSGPLGQLRIAARASWVGYRSESVRDRLYYDAGPCEARTTL